MTRFLRSAQRDEVFQSFRKELSNPALSEETKLLMLRCSATTHYWSADQVRQLVMCITYQRRVDAAVMLFRRTVDLDNYYAKVDCSKTSNSSPPSTSPARPSIRPGHPLGPPVTSVPSHNLPYRTA